MALPMFFHEEVLQQNAELALSEETARHVVQVLRMHTGERVQLTDGKGNLATTVISKTEKKRCSVVVEKVETFPERAVKFHLGVAFTKNTSRNEWILEKATELGASSIIPIMATRSERERIRYDRWHNILVSALLQSQQYYLPNLPEAMTVKEILQRFNHVPQKLIGHCIEGFNKQHLATAMLPGKETIMLIGPEGDFTKEEVELCTGACFSGVNLGKQRLRTETAATAVCAYYNMINYES